MQDSRVPDSRSVYFAGGENIPKKEQDQESIATVSLVLDVLRFLIEVLKALL